MEIHNGPTLPLRFALTKIWRMRPRPRADSYTVVEKKRRRPPAPAQMHISYIFTTPR